MMRFCLAIFTSLAVLSFGCVTAEDTPSAPAAARGQVVDPPPAEDDEKNKTADPKKPAVVAMDPLEVRATRLQPDRQASTTTLTRGDVEHGNLQMVRDLSRVVPNFVLDEGGDRRSHLPSMRGLLNNTFGNPGVITYVDDVPITDWRALNIDLFDIDSIEVTRGPSAETTHGANAEAGLIDIRTLQPANKLEAHGMASYGNYDTQVYRGSVSGPIIKDKLMFRLSGLESKRDGYLKNTFLDERPDYRDMLAGRLQLRALPLPELEINLTAEAQRADDGTQSYVPLPSVKSFKVAYNDRGREELDASLGALRIQYAAPGVTVTSITSRRSWESDDSLADLDFSPAPLLTFIDEHEFVQWSQELRVQSNGNQKNWQWKGGAYFEDRGTDLRFGTRISDTAFIQAAPPAGLGLPFTAPVTDHREIHLYTQIWAAFGQATWMPLEKFALTFGLRYEHHQHEMQSRHDLLAPTQSTTVPLSTADRQRESDVVLPKLAASYQVTPDLSVYASAGQGYRPGGFSYLEDDPAFQTWRPEFLWNFEVGLKSAWLNDRLTFNLSLFSSNVDDYQVRRQAGLSFRVDNGDATSRGFEVEVAARPVKGLDITFGLGYADARFDDYTDRATGENFDGNRLTLSPRYTLSLASQYLHRTGFYARAEYQGSGSYVFAEDNRFQQDAFGLVHAKVGYEQKHFGVYLYSRNVFDQTYAHFGLPSPVGGLISAPGDPRTFGIMATFKY